MDFSDISMDDIQTDSDKSIDSWNEMQSSVSWQSSQPTNPILNQLMSSAALEPRPFIASSSRAWQKSTSLEIIPGYSSPVQGSASDSFNSPSNMTSSGRPSTSRPQIRPRNPGDRMLGRTSSEKTIPALSTAVPHQFLDLVKGVSESLNESAGIPTRSVAGPSNNRGARIRNKDRRPSERRGPVNVGPLRKPPLGRVVSADSRLPTAAVKGKARAVDIGNSMEGVESVVGAGPSYTGKRGEWMMDDNDSMIDVDKDRMRMTRISSEAITTFPRTPSQAQMPPPMGLPRKHPPNSTDQASRNHDMASSAFQPVLPPTQHQPVQSRKAEDKPLRRDPVPKLHPLLQKQAPLTTQGTPSSNSVSYLDKPVSNASLSRGFANSSSSLSVDPPLPSTPTLSSTPSLRPPVLGMRRTHTLPLRGSAAANQKGGFSTRPRAFKPPLLTSSQPNASSQTHTLHRDNLPEKCVTITSSGISSASSNSSSLSGQTQSSYSSSGTISTPSGSSTLPLPSMLDSKSEVHSKKITQVDSVAHPIPQTPPLPEPADGDPDSSFGNMSFDLDALEETMKMYD
ncbi:hypothetical protein BJ165DRAFT_214462 [Panaeolus papilionaceus]|nr:hypothetical protein BJ165DRAFT_214462 [Panaeolus papilionaceus]